MKYNLIALSICIFCCSLHGQNSIDSSLQVSIVTLPNAYKEKGIVFSKSYKVDIELKDFNKRYTPSIDDVILAESIFKQKYRSNANKSISSQAFFCCWVRQYLGYIDKQGNKNLVIQFINNTKPRKVNKLIGAGWETTYIVALSDEFYKISMRYRVNLETGELSARL